MRKRFPSAWRLGVYAGLLLGSLVQAPPAAGEPYLALRQGQKCSFCHVNRTGGGKRTVLFGSVATAMLQPAGLLGDGPVAGKFSSGVLNEDVSLGANVRVVNVSSFRDDPDREGRVDNGEFFRSADSNDFDIDEGVAYLQVDLLDDRLTLYVDESFAPGGASNRETVGIIQGILPAGGYIKAGRFFPPFGLRIQDDAAFTRSATGFNFSRQDTGLEIGFTPGQFFFAASITNGDEAEGNGFGKQLNLHAYGLLTNVPAGGAVLAGGSLAYNDPADRTVAGIHGGVSFRSLGILGEVDWVREDVGGQPVERWATHTEINWWARSWLNVKFAYDYLEPDVDIDEDERERYVLGIEAFIHENLQARLLYEINNDIPQRPQGNFNELIAEVHLFF